MPTVPDDQFRDAVESARTAAERRFASPARRPWLDDALSHAADAVRRAAERFNPALGDFPGWARSFAAAALDSLLSRLARHARSRPRPIDETREGQSPLPGPDRFAPHSIPAETLAGLTEHQRDVIRRRFELRQSFAEIGRARGTTKQSAHVIYQRGIARLRKRMRNPSDGG